MNTTRQISVVLGGIALVLLAACNEDAKVAQTSAMAATAAPTAERRSHEVCTDEVVTTAKPVKDKNQVLGTVAGAVVGGVVGHEVGGKGTSQDIATGVGAVAGGYAGNRVQKSVQNGATEKSTERVCHTVYD
ncbi:MAG: glycine zipper 2TM domain-containing protein [Pseudomonadota bacterium]